MKKLVLMVFAGALLTSLPVTNVRAQTDRIEKDKSAIENRKARKQDARIDKELKRADRENYRQRKKMERESSRANRRRGYDTNENGNVFGL